MFHHILTRERDVFWKYGEVTCAAFSLKDLDTVRFFFIMSYNDHYVFVERVKSPLHYLTFCRFSISTIIFISIFMALPERLTQRPSSLISPLKIFLLKIRMLRRKKPRLLLWLLTRGQVIIYVEGRERKYVGRIKISVAPPPSPFRPCE